MLLRPSQWVTPTHLHILCVCFSCEKFSLYVYPFMCQVFNWRAIFLVFLIFINRYILWLGNRLKYSRLQWHSPGFYSWVSSFLFCPLPWAISPSSMAWSPPSCAWVQMSFCSSDLRWLTHNFNCLPGRFSWTYHRKFVMATADGWWVVRAHLDFWPGDQWKRGLHFCGGRAEMKCGNCWQLFSSSDACS